MFESEPWYKSWERHRWVIFAMLWVFGGFMLVTMGNVRGERLEYIDPRRPPIVVQEGRRGSTERLEELLFLDALALLVWGWISHKAGQAKAKSEEEEDERQLRQSLRYQELIQKGYSPDEARAQIGREYAEIQLILGRRIFEQQGIPLFSEEERGLADRLEAKWKASEAHQESMRPGSLSGSATSRLSHRAESPSAPADNSQTQVVPQRASHRPQEQPHQVSVEEDHWLATREAFQQGWSAEWLRTQEGQAWLKTPEGHDYIHRLGRTHGSLAAEIEGRVVPTKTQEPPADLGGQAFQRGWSCPTCGSPSKAARWKGDEVIRECVNGHRSVIWRLSNVLVTDVLDSEGKRTWSQETYPQTREELLTYLEMMLKSYHLRGRQKWRHVLSMLRYDREDREWQRLVSALKEKQPYLIQGEPNEAIDKLMRELRDEWLH